MSLDLSSVFLRINKEIASLSFGDKPQELYDPITYIMNLGGKRLRPLLCVFGNYLFNGNLEEIIRPSIAIEVFHNFTLMHDDIMDKAPLRRGKPTVHEKWNNNIAILSGDVMLVKAYDFLLGVSPTIIKEVIYRFNQCAASVCEGQQLDMNYQYANNISEGEYLEMIRLKTAVLVGFSLEMGSLIAGTDENNLKLLKSFGEKIGVGFQLKDDLLDVYADKEKFGKQVGGDILSNKKTYLLIQALDKSDTNQKACLEKWLNAIAFDADEKIREVTNIFEELDIRSLTQQKMDEYFSSAFKDLEAVKAEDSQKQELMNLAKQLIEREN